MTADELIHEMSKGLLKWYPFKKESSAVYITAKQEANEAMSEALRECGLCVDCLMADVLLQPNMSKKYDYIVILSALEQVENISAAISILKKVCGLLRENGTILIGVNNRLGIRYFCGDRDIYTLRNFDSIENYIHVDAEDSGQPAGRSFAKGELIEMLEKTGLVNHRFYSVFPLIDKPQVLFAEDYTPIEKMDIRIFPQYNFPNTVFLEEERLYDTLIHNGLFHVMANGFLIECPLNGVFANANQVTMSMNRGKKNAMFTIIRRDGRVEKRAAYQEGKEKVKALAEHHAYLSKRGISMIDAYIENYSYVMPCVNEISALEYLRRLLAEDREMFLHRLDELWKIILTSSEYVPYSEIDWERYEPYWEKKKKDYPNKDRWKKLAYGSREEQEHIGAILKKGYIDLVPLNCFWKDGKFMFYDQELYVENLPAKVILLRTIDIIYMGNPQLNSILPSERVKERYDLNECRDLFYKFVSKFLNDFRNDNILSFYYQKVRADKGILNANRQRMNYSVEDYERIFRNIFKNVENRRLFLFGSGNFTKQFLSQFGNDYKIEGIIDNNTAKWGTKLNGIQIYAPEMLMELEPGTFKVIICIKNYLAVMFQLQSMGITDFSVYDSNISYPKSVVQITHSNQEIHKKYGIGYIAGVFDLFHIGHLNLFKRAKEQCNYLIVGVVTDEGVKNDKGTVPFIPFEERLELVRSCRYVDEAVEIPPDRSNTDEAYRRYQFDVQFSGSDYANSKEWLAKKKYLQERGSDLVFFPYTESTSSTKIKEMIQRKLV